MEILVSTDVVGFFGSPRDLDKVYAKTKEILRNCGRDFNLEVIGWRHRYKKYLSKAGGLGYKVIGLHGRMGQIPTHKLKMKMVLRAMNETLISTPLLTKININNGYVLVHESEVNQNRKKFSKLNFSSLLMVENNPVGGSFPKTVEAVKFLNKKGIRSGIMIDLVHLIKERYKESNLNKLDNFSKCFEKTIKYVGEKINNSEIVGFHVPIGDNHDSLPKEIMKKSDWMLLAQLIDSLGKKCKFVVLENQYNRSRYFLWDRDVETVAENTAAAVKTLAEYGII